jgi:hypothetical protein
MLPRTQRSIVAAAIIALLASCVCAGAAERKLNAKRDLIVFVGKRISVTRVEPTPTPKDVMVLDAEFKARYEVLHVVFGSYTAKEISFTVYDHYGEPAFSQYETSLIFVARHKGKLYHEKYQFFPVYPTTDRRWASCGDAGQWEIGYERKTKLKPVPITFVGEITDKATGRQCTDGNYVEDLFSLRRDGVLKARGWVF